MQLPTKIIDDKLYPMREVKQYLPVSDATYWRWEKAGHITFVRIGKTKFVRGSTLRSLTKEGAA